MPKIFRLLLPALASCLLSILALSCSKKSSTAPDYTTGGGELSGSLATTGSQYAHTFATAGTFNYKCAIHPSCASLAGTIVVIAAGGVIQNRVLAITQSGGSAGTYATCSSLSLQRDTVFVGDQVTWTNNSPLAHTVTSQ